jgi:hypothetical protein
VNERCLKVIDLLRGRTLSSAINIVNEFIRSEVNHDFTTRKTKRWQPPLLTAQNGGNSIDLAVLKMYLLIQSGVDENLLSIGLHMDYGVLLYKSPHARFFFSRSKMVTWIADIIPPYTRLLQGSDFYITEEYTWKDINLFCNIR